MKALELTVYPKLERPLYGHQIEGYRQQVKAEIELREAKRFTDAELAAELFSAVFHEAECEVRGRKLEVTHPDHPAIDHYVKHNHEFGRQAGIIERFATLPHYDEADNG